MITVKMQVSGLDNIKQWCDKFPENVEKVVGKALTDSIAMGETEAKRRTPILTGYLQSSIGGDGGYSYVKGLTAGVGTNVVYAARQEEGYFRHRVGERKYMEKGAIASEPFIEKRFEKAMEELANLVK